MRKNVFLLVILISTICVAQQERYQTRTGEIKFEGSVPSFEPIEAVNKSATIVFDAQNGTIASLALMKGFKFPIALMQEHFNENYVESDEYPKATLRGSLTDFDMASLSDHLDHTYTFSGTLEMHGVKNTVSFPITLKEQNEAIHITAIFSIIPKDYNIEIPSIVSKKIAEEIQVAVNATLYGK